MDFTDDPALRSHLQTFYDEGYAQCVNENTYFHTELQSEKTQEFLHTHDFYYGPHVPLPPFTVEEVILSHRGISCRVEGNTIFVRGMQEREVTEVSLHPLRIIAEREEPEGRRSDDTFYFGSSSQEVSYPQVGATVVCVHGKDFHPASAEIKYGFFCVNGHSYGVRNSNTFTHLASGKDETVEGIMVRNDDQPNCVFSHQNSFYQIWHDGTIRRVYFGEPGILAKPFSKGDALHFFEEEIREM